MVVNVGDAVLFKGNKTIYEVSGVINNTGRVFCNDEVNGEFEKKFSDIDVLWSRAIPTHKISGCYFSGTGEFEATWEDIETGKTVWLARKVDDKKGRALAEVICPCVYQLGSVCRNEQK